jgi:dihydrofolate reductase
VPVFVISHGTPSEVPEGSVYTFVDGIERGLAAAKAAAGDRDVTVMGGAQIGQQYLRAGLVNEMSIHLVPVLFEAGTRMLENPGDRHAELETVAVTETPAATHLRLRLLRPPEKEL